MKEKKIGLYVKLTSDDKKVVEELRNRFAINISQFIRTALRDKLDVLTESNEAAKR